MGDTWQVKCGPTFQPPVQSLPSTTSQPEPLRQLEMGSGKYHYPQDRQNLGTQVHGSQRRPHPTFSNNPNLGSHVGEGSSLLALVSGPPSISQFDFSNLSSSKPVRTSNKLFGDGTSMPAFAIGSHSPLTFNSPSNWHLLESSSQQSVRNRVVVGSGLSPRAVASSNSSVCSSWLNVPLYENFSLQPSDMGRAVVNHYLSGIEKAKAIPLSQLEWCNSTPSNGGKLHNDTVHVMQQVPQLAGASISNTPSTFTDSCHRVFCLGKSGDLLISNTGILGILCSCHHINMSVSKFSEHSGLQNVNPGEAIHMGNGESIAQWRKLYFQKLGIRAPEDQSGWEWPEGMPLTAGSIKSFKSIPSMPMNSECNYSGRLRRCETMSKQHLDNSFLPSNPYVYGSSDKDALDNTKHRNIHVGNENFLNGFATIPQKNVRILGDDHLMDCTTSRCSTVRKIGVQEPENHWQSVSAYIADLANAGSASVTHPTLSNLSSIISDKGIKSGIMDIDRASSRIELRLGQPCQQHQSSVNSGLSETGSQLCSLPLKPFSQKQLTHDACHGVGEESSVGFPFASGMSNTTMTGGKEWLNNGNYAYGSLIDVYRNEQLKTSTTKAKVISTVSTQYGESSLHGATDDVFHIGEQKIPQVIHNGSHTVKYKPLHYPQNGENSIERQCIAPELHFFGAPEKGPSMEWVLGDYNSNRGSSSRKHDSMDNPSGVLSGYSSSGLSKAYDTNLYSPHFSRELLHESDARSSPKNFPKVPSCKSNGQFGHMFLRSAMNVGQILPSREVPTRFSSYASLCTPESNSVLQKDKSISRGPCLLDDNLRLLALRETFESSKQQSTILSLEKNSQQQRFAKSTNVMLHNSAIQHSLSGEQMRCPHLTSEQEMSGVLKVKHFGHVDMDSDSEKFASITGSKGCCASSRLAHGMPSKCKDFDLHSQLSHDSHWKNMGTCQLQNCISYGHESENCQQEIPLFGCNFGSAVHVCPERKCELKDIYSPTSVRDSANGQRTKLAASEWFDNHIVAKGNMGCPNQCVQSVGKLPGKISYNYQWKDVPSRVGIFERECTKQSSGILDDIGQNLGELEGDAANGSNGAVRIGDSLKEQEMSYVSSGCSYPAERPVIMVDSSAVAENFEYTENCVVDEGSGIDKYGSSGDAIESDRSADFYSSTKISPSEGKYKGANYQTSRSLLDEVKLMDALTWKKGRKQEHVSHIFHDKRNLMQESVMGLKSRKRKGEMKLEDAKCKKSMSSMVESESCKRCRQRLSNGRYNGDDQNGFSGTCFDDLSRKRLRSCGTSKCFVQFQIQESDDVVGEKVMRPVNFMKGSPSWKENINCRKDDRPIACGKYGVLIGGKIVSNPVKIVSLDRIYKATKKCTPTKKGKLRQNYLRELKLTNCSHINSSCTKISGLEKVKEGENNRQSACESLMSDEEKSDKNSADCVILELDAQAVSKPKIKEVRERSIYELTFNGINSRSNMGVHNKFFGHMPQIEAQEVSESSGWIVSTLCRTQRVKYERCLQKQRELSLRDTDWFCSVCRSPSKDEVNCLLECGRCFIKVHQACYGVSKVPQSHWYCRPCRTSSRNIVCVLCGYGGGAMTQALRSRTIVKSLLKAWYHEMELRPRNVYSSSKTFQDEKSKLDSSAPVSEISLIPSLTHVNIEPSASAVWNAGIQNELAALENSWFSVDDIKVHNSITSGVLDSTVKQWIHMVCGLWTPGTRCPNVDTMSAFDVSGVAPYLTSAVCSICNRPGGSCIQCRVVDCTVRFHPWCAHLKGLLQSEVEGANGENVGFYGRCFLHAACQISESVAHFQDIDLARQGAEEPSCARTEGYKGRKHDGFWHNVNFQSKGKTRCLVHQDQLNAWIHINGQRSFTQGFSKLPVSAMEYDSRKEYARYKQAKGWRRLVVYKSGIHALGLYTSQFISRGEMVVEYVGEIVGLRVSDKREKDYQSGRRVQYKSACYFFRIDQEHVIDATRKGGIARFVNHSCLPNCVAKVISVRNEKKVVFFAERDIYPGEEVTYDYNFNNEDEGMKIPCYCNSKNCRRYLN